ncbi:MAG: hypothetical protein JW947_08250 [Sedimentisphaerales bacterium]|nr:hypothetical protein [Sedimentisphaerales bacterium]
MKKMIILFLLLSVTSGTLGAVSARVCLSDGITPLELADPCIPNEYRDIMVGTKLTVLVSSDVAEYWYAGDLVVAEAEMANIGLLYGRDCEFGECPGSCLPDAGEDAAVWDTYMFPGPGFEFYGGFEPNVGDWFIFDYNALEVGDCNVLFYEYQEIEGEPVPVLLSTMTFHHTRTRDFNGDTKVDFADFAILASYWQEDNCGSLNNCEGADLDNNDGDVDLGDLMEFCKFWLEKTE